MNSSCVGCPVCGSIMTVLGKQYRFLVPGSGVLLSQILKLSKWFWNWVMGRDQRILKHLIEKNPRNPQRESWLEM